MTTNSSSLLVSEIEDVVKRGDKFAAMHFHGFGTVVDIMRGPHTSEATVELLKRFVRSLEEVPIVLKKEKDGYVHNTMYIALLQSAASLVIGGYTDIEDVDRSWMAVHRSMAGPFGMIDGVGLDVAMNVAEAQAQRGRGEVWQEMADFIRSYVKRGELGVKTGKGFYTYPNPSYQQPDFLKGK
jgi:3-hydroxybutyryl-CoA dehydrogenase